MTYISDDNRTRCPICECVMHGNRHYGSDRTHILVRGLKAQVKNLEAAIRLTCSGDTSRASRLIRMSAQNNKVKTA